MWEVVLEKSGEKLFDLAEKQGWVDRLLAMFKKKHRILVLGSTGTGKTNLLASLTQAMPEAIAAMNRTEFATRHRINLSGTPFVFVDTPGQVGHGSRRLGAIREEMANGLSGVINVVAYGYHEYRIDRAEAIDVSGNVVPDYLDRHQKVELDALREWTPLLGSPLTTGWLLTVVTKADLWWGRHDKVLTHYRSGDYFEALGDARTLHPIVLPNSSVLHKFYGVGSLAGSLDEADRLHMRSHLMHTVLAAVGKGGGVAIP